LNNSLSMPTKSCLRFWNSNRRFAPEIRRTSRKPSRIVYLSILSGASSLLYARIKPKFNIPRSNSAGCVSRLFSTSPPTPTHAMSRRALSHGGFLSHFLNAHGSLKSPACSCVSIPGFRRHRSMPSKSFSFHHRVILPRSVIRQILSPVGLIWD
jgi:hypothetical protein